MPVNYNYTGYYALQLNYLDASGAFATDEYSNIPGNGMGVVPVARSASLAVVDTANTTAATLTLSGYTAEVLSANLLLYFNVEVTNLQKVVSQAVPYSLSGNVVSSSASGVLKIDGNQPIEG
jgi:hypothetical protein